jgi:hypothetical protein
LKHLRSRLALIDRGDLLRCQPQLRKDSGWLFVDRLPERYKRI